MKIEAETHTVVKCCWTRRQNKKAPVFQHSAEKPGLLGHSVANLLEKLQSTRSLSPIMHYKGLSEERACLLYLQDRIPDILVALPDAGQTVSKFLRPGYHQAGTKSPWCSRGRKGSVAAYEGHQDEAVTACSAEFSLIICKSSPDA